MVRKELGKWIMDIAKYMATVILVSTLFRDIQEKSITLVIGGATVVIFMIVALSLLKEPKDKKPKKKR